MTRSSDGARQEPASTFAPTLAQAVQTSCMLPPLPPVQQFLAALLSPVPPFPLSSFVLLSTLLPLPFSRPPLFCRSSLLSLLFHPSVPFLTFHLSHLPPVYPTRALHICPAVDPS